jgi:hypothetical protein
MPKIKLPIDQGRYDSDLDTGSRQFSFNMWPSFTEQAGSLTPTRVHRTPGLVDFSSGITAGINDTYAGFVVDKSLSADVLYVSYGTKIYKVASTGTVTAQTGAAVNGANWASMAANQQRIIAIIRGNNQAFFLDTSTSVITEITDATFNAIVGTDPLIAVAYIDSRFIFATSKTIFAASLETTNKGRDFDVNETHEPNYNSDQIRDLIVNDGLLYVIGQVSIEAYDTTGAAGFPMDRVENIVLDKGGLMPGRTVVVNDDIYIIARDSNSPYGVYRVSGNRFTKISTDTIDRGLAQEDLDIEPNFTENLSKLFQITHDGHTFVCLYVHDVQTFTYCYDISESQRTGRKVWHRRSGLPNNIEYFIKDTVSIYDKHLALGSWVGSNQRSAVVEIDTSIGTEFTLDTLHYVSSYYLSDHGNRVKIKKATVRSESESGSKLNLFVADRESSFAALGERDMDGYSTWNRLGSKRDFTFIIANSADLVTPYSSSSDLTVYDLTIEVE